MGSVPIIRDITRKLKSPASCNDGVRGDLCEIPLGEIELDLQSRENWPTCTSSLYYVVNMPNKPRNFLITDASVPFKFSYATRYLKHQSLTLYQTDADASWPGGAVWDSGILLANVIVLLSGGTTVSLHTDVTKSLKLVLPKRLETIQRYLSSLDRLTILELGCGVGLTGLVAAEALSSSLTVLTDLEVVIQNVTTQNVEVNSSAKRKIIACPLCWGSRNDEKQVLSVFQGSVVSSKSKQKKGKNKNQELVASYYPKLLLIGDVAYQHEPGAPSHFPQLIETVLNVTDESTLILFGTRIRMPASVDLLDMFLEHMDPVIDPCAADEIDPSFRSLKHNMTVHFFRRKKRSLEKLDF